MAVGLEGKTIDMNPCLCSVHSGLQAGSCRSTNRLAGERIIEVRSVLCHPIEIGREIEWVPVDSRGVPALLVSEEDNDIRRLIVLSQHEPSISVSADKWNNKNKRVCFDPCELIKTHS